MPSFFDFDGDQLRVKDYEITKHTFKNQNVFQVAHQQFIRLFPDYDIPITVIPKTGQTSISSVACQAINSCLIDTDIISNDRLDKRMIATMIMHELIHCYIQNTDVSAILKRYRYYNELEIFKSFLLKWSASSLGGRLFVNTELIKSIGVDKDGKTARDFLYDLRSSNSDKRILDIVKRQADSVGEFYCNLLSYTKANSSRVLKESMEFSEETGEPVIYTPGGTLPLTYAPYGIINDVTDPFMLVLTEFLYWACTLDSLFNARERSLLEEISREEAICYILSCGAFDIDISDFVKVFPTDVGNLEYVSRIRHFSTNDIIKSLSSSDLGVYSGIAKLFEVEK